MKLYKICCKYAPVKKGSDSINSKMFYQITIIHLKNLNLSIWFPFFQLIIFNLNVSLLVDINQIN